MLRRSILQIFLNSREKSRLQTVYVGLLNRTNCVLKDSLFHDDLRKLASLFASRRLVSIEILPAANRSAHNYTRNARDGTHTIDLKSLVTRATRVAVFRSARNRPFEPR